MNMVMEIIISMILLTVGVTVLVFIHVCIVRRAFRRGMVQRSEIFTKRMSDKELEKLPCYEFKVEENGNRCMDCAVCLENFKVDDKCRLLPNCKHSFHAQCIDSWLLKTMTPICPICRTCAISNIELLLEEERCVSNDV